MPGDLCPLPTRIDAGGGTFKGIDWEFLVTQP